MSPNVTGIKLPRGMGIRLENNLSFGENKLTGSCQCWVKGSLGCSEREVYSGCFEQPFALSEEVSLLACSVPTVCRLGWHAGHLQTWRLG